MCGASLAHPPAPEAQPPIRDVRPSGTGNLAPEFAPEAAPVNGPSFLGLADEPAENPKHEFHYLYEDEPPRSHAGLIMVLLVLAIAGAAIGWQWHHSGFPFNSQRTPGQSASSSESGSASATRDTHVDNPATGASSVTPTLPEKSVPVPTDAAPSDNASSAGTSSGNPSTSNENDAERNSGTASAKGRESSAERATAAKKTASKESNTEETEAEATPPATVPPASVPRRSRVTKASTRTPSRPQVRRAVEEQESAPGASPDADLELTGEKYLYGTGVPQNCARADSSLRTAAQHGNTKAQTVLGTMYATGHCVTRDLPTAYRWFARALHKDPQNSRISADLQVLWRQMSPQEKQMATANNPQPN